MDPVYIISEDDFNKISDVQCVLKVMSDYSSRSPSDSDVSRMFSVFDMLEEKLEIVLTSADFKPAK